jgi:hypothetical protein
VKRQTIKTSKMRNSWGERRKLQEFNRDSEANPRPKNSVKNYMSDKIDAVRFIDWLSLWQTSFREDELTDYGQRTADEPYQAAPHKSLGCHTASKRRTRYSIENITE